MVTSPAVGSASGSSAPSLVLAPSVALARGGSEIPRMPDGQPDLSGTYDIATLTPLQRPERFGDKQFLTDEEAAKIEERGGALMRGGRGAERSQPRGAADGGDGSEGASGNVGGYNAFWIDRGTARVRDRRQVRTSIIVDPPNGRYPPMTAEARRDGSRPLRRRRSREPTGRRVVASRRRSRGRTTT